MSSFVTEDSYRELSGAYEYRAALAQFLLPEARAWKPAPGEFLPMHGWFRGAVPAGEKDFLAMLSRTSDGGWNRLLGGEPEARLAEFHETLRRL